MKKFLVLYHSEGALLGLTSSELFAKSTPEQMAAGMGAWREWINKAGSGIADIGMPLDHSNTVLAKSDSPGKSTITGYSFLQANSMTEAIALVKGHPHFLREGSSIQILECIPMPGM